MRKTMIVAALLAAGATLPGCRVQDGGHAEVDTAAIANSIREQEAAWVRDWASGDVDRVVSHFAEGAAMMVPNGARMTGPAAIRAGLANMVRDPNLDLRFAPDRVEVAASGDMAYSRGTYSLRVTDARTGRPVSETGNYITAWRRQPDGSWKVVDDIASTGAPPAPATAAQPPG